MSTIKIGTRIQRLDPSSSSHLHPGSVIAMTETHAEIQWDPMQPGGKGRTNKVALAAEGKRWQQITGTADPVQYLRPPSPARSACFRRGGHAWIQDDGTILPNCPDCDEPLADPLRNVALTCAGMGGSSCPGPASHIDNKGYVYCERHGLARRASGAPTRKLTAAESKKLARGETISYARKPRR